MTTQSQTTSWSSRFSNSGEMKRSASELALQELVNSNFIGVGASDFQNNKDDKMPEFRTQGDKVFADIDDYLGEIYTGDFSFIFKNRVSLHSLFRYLVGDVFGTSLRCRSRMT